MEKWERKREKEAVTGTAVGERRARGSRGSRARGTPSRSAERTAAPRAPPAAPPESDSGTPSGTFILSHEDNELEGLQFVLL